MEKGSQALLLDKQKGLYCPIYWELISFALGIPFLTKQHNGMTDGFKHCSTD